MVKDFLKDEIHRGDENSNPFKEGDLSSSMDTSLDTIESGLRSSLDGNKQGAEEQRPSNCE